jgi:hypothetical protein
MIGGGSGGKMPIDSFKAILSAIRTWSDDLPPDDQARLAYRINVVVYERSHVQPQQASTETAHLLPAFQAVEGDVFSAESS